MMYMWVHAELDSNVVNLWDGTELSCEKESHSPELIYLVHNAETLQTKPFTKLSPISAALLSVWIKRVWENGLSLSLSLSISFIVGKWNYQEWRTAITLQWIRVSLGVNAQRGYRRLFLHDLDSLAKVMGVGFHDNDALWRDRCERAGICTF